MERVCFQLQVRPDRLDEYRDRHAAVWPSMLEAIAASGRRNYSLFLRDDGQLTGYYETDDDAESQRLLAENPATAPWEAEMAEFFVDLAGAEGERRARLCAHRRRQEIAGRQQLDRRLRRARRAESILQ